MTVLRVAALELPARWREPERGLADAARLLSTLGPIDLALLPELSLTGYVSPALESDQRPVAEPHDGPTARALSDLARAHGVHLAGPFVERDGDELANTTLLFAPDGALVARYRKRHPWYPESWATPGREPLPLIDVRGVCVTIATCFDLHFVHAESASELRAADVLLFPSAWVERHDTRALRLCELARAFEIGVVNANWGAGLPLVHGQGGSLIVSRSGAVVASAPNGDAHAARAIVADLEARD